ncbi:hypothetical protein G6645_08580 [Polynucleobacter paneuropaeus]|nr:hypothetical protein [Polynucleobacter paneuropaeus]MBT8532383.1 hypothetical protein [Polynucleobacter paneuropaeus]MBT8602597.1 hypothetical protein [Polynucleobacter paneuropaeus]MBT8624787.1 hypothetical protein [Polynucleobacter paneuropaeus]MBT8630102.1 hypothetical protein [Polynucleobacter paneuropaeus]
MKIKQKFYYLIKRYVNPKLLNKLLIIRRIINNLFFKNNIYNREIKFLDSILYNKKFIYQKTFVDIGASNGVSNSNTFKLFINGWKGIAIESDRDNYKLLSAAAKGYFVKTVNALVDKENIGEILKKNDCPVNFGFLNLDIDSFEWDILNEILGKFKPSLICVEINERIPPPISFKVKDHLNPIDLGGPFYGMSIQAAYNLVEKYDYKVIGLFYNNLYIVPKDVKCFEEIDVRSAYKYGYVDAYNRKRIFHWNHKYDYLLEFDENLLKKEIMLIYSKYKNYEID